MEPAYSDVVREHPGLEAEVNRLRAIEAAAREYREAWESDAVADRDGWTILNRDARSRLFALLDGQSE